MVQVVRNTGDSGLWEEEERDVLNNTVVFFFFFYSFCSSRSILNHFMRSFCPGPSPYVNVFSLKYTNQTLVMLLESHTYHVILFPR